jgi:hypothetical protein
MMSLQLDNPVIDYKEFYGSMLEQMPLLISEKLKPISVAGIMRRYLELDALRSIVPNYVKHAVETVLKTWHDNYFDTGDGIVLNSNGKMKVVPDAKYIRNLKPQTNLVAGGVDLSESYEALPGDEFRKQDISKYCNKRLTESEAKMNPVWLALTREDRALLREYVDLRISESKQEYGKEYDLWSITLGSAPSQGAIGRSVLMLPTLLDIHAKRDFNNNGGRMVGVPPKSALKKAALEYRL